MPPPSYNKLKTVLLPWRTSCVVLAEPAIAPTTPLNASQMITVTRWNSLHAMLIREIRLYKPLQEFFTQNLSNRTVSNRTPKPVEWQAAREVVSVLDDAAQITKAIQGSRHAFEGKAINDLAVLETSLSLDTQDDRTRFYNRFICVGVDVSTYVLPTGGRI